MNDMMDGHDDLGLLESPNHPFLSHLSNMSLAQQPYMIPMATLPHAHNNGVTLQAETHIQHMQVHQMDPPHVMTSHSNEHLNRQMSSNVDMMSSQTPRNDAAVENRANHQMALFQEYVSQFGLKQTSVKPVSDNSNIQPHAQGNQNSHVINNENVANHQQQQQQQPQQHHNTNSVEAYAALMGVKLDSPDRDSMAMQKQQQQPSTSSNDASSHVPIDPRATMNAHYFESLMKMQGHHHPAAAAMASSTGLQLTSSTLPAGVGSGYHHHHHHPHQSSVTTADAARVSLMNVHGHSLTGDIPIKTEKRHHHHHHYPHHHHHQQQQQHLHHHHTSSTTSSSSSMHPFHGSGGLIGSHTLSPEMLSSMIHNNNMQVAAAANDSSFGSSTTWAACTSCTIYIYIDR